MSEPMVSTEAEQLRRNWGWLLALGLVLVVLGTVGLSYAVFLTEISVLFFGILLLVTGVMHLANGFMDRGGRSLALHLLLGVLDVVVGLLIVMHPLEMAVQLTLLLAAFLLVGGIFRIVMALAMQMGNWGWELLGGAISVLLGLALWRQWPVSGLWFLGFCVALDMIFRGWSWVMLSLAVRRLPTRPL